MSELKSHAPVLAAAVERIRGSVAAEFVLVLAESLGRTDLSKAIPGGIKGLRVIDQDGYNAMAAADIVLSACGTATLEAALLGTPVVAFYRISPLTYHARKAVCQDPAI